METLTDNYFAETYNKEELKHMIESTIAQVDNAYKTQDWKTASYGSELLPSMIAGIAVKD